ncbi:DUF2250 domain-containing protein [Halorutilales archaeon Cl-col2-1]
MVSQKEIETLRQEAQTIFTRIDEVNGALEDARKKEGDHWDDGSLDLSLKTPSGDEIEVELDLDKDAAENAQERYEEAKEMEEVLEEKKEVEGELAGAPSDPLAYLILYHLKKVKGDYPRSMAMNLDAERKDVVDLCDQLESAGLIERIESGMLKRRKVKLKRSLETHQHHTYYRLSREGDHLLRFLEEDDGKESFLRKVDNALTVARRISEGGPDYPRMTSEDLDLDLGHVRKLYKAMVLAGVAETYDGSIIKGKERKLKPKDETHRKHTYYVTTRDVDLILRDWED